jgi:hypothetical protein
VRSRDCEGCVLESQHPYDDNLDVYVAVALPGVEAYEISFDTQCVTERGCDYIRFYKDESHDEYWGSEKYTGKSFPELAIPSSKFIFYFHSDGSNNDWGFKVLFKPCTLSVCHRFEEEQAKVVHHSGVMRCKCAHNSGDESYPIDSSRVHLNADCLWTCCGAAWSADVCGVEEAKKSVFRYHAGCLHGETWSCCGVASTDEDHHCVYESKHPYDNDTDFLQVIEIPGAEAYSVVFDSRSSTERSCDYVTFFKDGERSAFWGRDKYSGGYDGSEKTFPGVEPRPFRAPLPPLIIPAESFVLYFHSDGSNVDWGFKVIVTPCTIPSELPLSVGDRVRVREVEEREAMKLQRRVGLTKKMLVELGARGLVSSIDIDGDIEVDMPSGNSFTWAPAMIVRDMDSEGDEDGVREETGEKSDVKNVNIEECASTGDIEEEDALEFSDEEDYESC